MSQSPRELVVSSKGTPFAQDITVRNHTLSADEPIDVGGGDTGPDPYELLLASLGSCTAITVQMYARNKGWRVENVTVRLTHTKVHAKDCQECEEETGYIDVIGKQVDVVGDLTDEQHARLRQIADKCPVHRTLEGVLHVHTQTSD